MPETKKPVLPMRVEYQCDECGNSSMVAENIMLPTHPPKYPHTCDKCGASQTFIGKTYPYIIHGELTERAAPRVFTAPGHGPDGEWFKGDLFIECDPNIFEGSKIGKVYTSRYLAEQGFKELKDQQCVDPYSLPEDNFLRTDS